MEKMAGIHLEVQKAEE